MKGKKGQFFLEKDFLVSAGVGIICLALFIIFPTSNVFEQIVSATAFLLLTPIFYVKIILKKNLKNYGLGIGEWKTGLVWSVISLTIVFLIFYLLFHYSDFPQKYYQYFFKGAINNFWIFVLYELILVAFFYIIYEFFFRGFIIFSFRKFLGYWIIGIQSIAFFLYFWLSGGLNWSVFPILLFSPFAGIVAYFSRSVLYSFVSAVLLNIIIDIAIINTFK
jgi:membrane protease YdiL (CAAX protease family)